MRNPVQAITSLTQITLVSGRIAAAKRATIASTSVSSGGQGTTSTKPPRRRASQRQHSTPLSCSAPLVSTRLPAGKAMLDATWPSASAVPCVSSSSSGAQPSSAAQRARAASAWPSSVSGACL
jgi:hypothetical protein